MEIQRDGKGIVDALGLGDKQVTSIDIHLQAGEVGTVVVKMLESLEQNEELQKVLREYKLVPKED